MGCQQNLAQMITDEANAQGVPSDLALAIAQRESNTCHWWSNGQVKIGGSGEVGVFQVMPSSARGLNLYDVQQNIQAGVGYLASLYQQFGDWSTAAMAYNWGPAKVADYIAGKRALPGQVASYAAATAGQVGYGANVSSDDADALSAPAGGSGLIWAAAGVAALAIALAA
jgi:soluble lytic murein transglycosylase-like protein